MEYDYKKLCLRIVEMVGTQACLAQRLGISERSLSLKLNNQVSWKQPEISRTAEILGICPEMIPTYFFTERDQKVEQS